MAQRKFNVDNPDAQRIGSGSLRALGPPSEVLTWFADRRCYEERLDEFLARAVHSIHIVAVTCKLASPEGSLQDVLADKLRAGSGVEVAVSLLDHEAPAVAILADSLGLSRSELRARLRLVWQEWVSFSSSLRTAVSRFRLMQHTCLPFGSAFIVDAEQSHGIVHVETRLFGELPDDTFAYRVQGPGMFYRRNVASWRRVMDTGRPYGTSGVSGRIATPSRRSPQ